MADAGSRGGSSAAGEQLSSSPTVQSQMPARKSVVQSPGKDSPRSFCRACGYDLRASKDRCPDCGRAFDPSNPATFARRPPRSFIRRLRATLYVALILGLVASGGMLWLRHGWLLEQEGLINLQQNSDLTLSVQTELLNTSLRAHLPQRLGIYLERVVELDLYSTEMNDDDLKVIKQFTHLRGLMVQGPLTTDAGFGQLRGLSTIQKLYVACDQMTDVGAANLRGMHQMRDLVIIGGKITNSALDNFHDMPNLRTLTICENQVTREGLLRWMRRHPGVRVVDGPDGPLKQRNDD